MAQKLPKARAAVRSLPSYIPGARPDGRSMWKLSSNENPAPPSPEVLAALIDAASVVNRYPDMATTDLTAALAEHHGVSPDSIVIGNGSVAVIESILRAYCTDGDEVVYPWRSFEAYPICVQVSGATGIPVPLDGDARHDIGALIDAVTKRTKAIILCSPNNPTGTVLTEPEVRQILDSVPRHVLVALDEAYIEYVREPDAVDGRGLLDEYPNLLTLRTFSKAYGLAGLRVGYAIGNPDVLAPVRAVSTPFGVNGFAQHAAIAALRRRDLALDAVAETVEERQRVLAAIRADGWNVPQTHGNFFWLPLGADTARFVESANQRGLLVRGFASEGVRVTIGEPEANDAVIELLGQWRPAKGSPAR